jgi:hypothetical protein
MDLKVVRVATLVNSSNQLQTHAENGAKTGNVAVVRFLLYKNKQLLQHMHMRHILRPAPPHSDAVFRVIEFTEPLSVILHKGAKRANVLRRVNPTSIHINFMDHSSDMLHAVWLKNYSRVGLTDSRWWNDKWERWEDQGRLLRWYLSKRVHWY